MKLFLSLLIGASALTLSGCSLTEQLENRIACTVAKDKAFVVSEYGRVGISSQIADQDAKVICK